jgi:hypothetical protein
VLNRVRLERVISAQPDTAGNYEHVIQLLGEGWLYMGGVLGGGLKDWCPHTRVRDERTTYNSHSKRGTTATGTQQQEHIQLPFGYYCFYID